MVIFLIIITLLFLLAALGEKDKDKSNKYLGVFVISLVLSVMTYLFK